MDINNIDDVKELKALKAKIERKIKAQKAKPAKKNNAALFELIKNDHKRHVRPDGRKVFRSVVDYLECYVNGLPPLQNPPLIHALASLPSVEKLLRELIESVRRELSEGKTLSEVAANNGISIASCQKLKQAHLEIDSYIIE